MSPGASRFAGLTNGLLLGGGDLGLHVGFSGFQLTVERGDLLQPLDAFQLG